MALTAAERARRHRDRKAAIAAGREPEPRLRERHGMSKTAEYQAWRNMLNRCYNPKCDHYPAYGGRGIRVCDKWRNSFEAFFADVGPRPPGTTLERRNVHADYGPDNPCEWATSIEQSRNRTDNRFIEYGGRSMILADWEQETGIKRLTILMRLDRDHWTVGQALGFEPHKRTGHNMRHFIEYGGKSMSMTDWARCRNIHPAALGARISNGWTMGQALGFDPPPPRPGNSESPGAIRQRASRARRKARLGTDGDGY